MGRGGVIGLALALAAPFFGATAWAGWYVLRNTGTAAYVLFNNSSRDLGAMTTVWRYAAIIGVYSLLALAVGLALYWIVARFYTAGATGFGCLACDGLLCAFATLREV